MIAVPGKDGRVGLCGDYKVTVNPGMDGIPYLYWELGSTSLRLICHMLNAEWLCFKPRLLVACIHAGVFSCGFCRAIPRIHVVSSYWRILKVARCKSLLWLKLLHVSVQLPWASSHRQWTTEEFATFMNSCEVKDIQSAPYYPSIN